MIVIDILIYFFALIGFVCCGWLGISWFISKEPDYMQKQLENLSPNNISKLQKAFDHLTRQRENMNNIEREFNDKFRDI